MKLIVIALLVLGGCAPQEKAAETQAEKLAAIEALGGPAVPALAADEIPAPVGEIQVASPVSGARAAGLLVADGSAINNWFFEGQFRARLEVNGATLVEAPAMQAGEKNWTDPGMVGFRAELAFDVAADTPAVLVLSEDMPQPVKPDSDEAGPARTVRIPVILAPVAP